MSGVHELAKIAIVTSGHFCTNPRVWREADLLAEAKHDVTVIGVSYDAAQADLDQQMLKTRSWNHKPATDIRAASLSSRIQRNLFRLRSSCGRYLTARGIYDPHSLGYAVDRLLDAAKCERADLTIVHLEPAFWVGTQLQRDGFRIGADFEDWHSENLPTIPSWHKSRGFYAQIERQLLHTASHLTTTSYAMAKALSDHFDSRQPETIYNSVRSVVEEPLTHDDGLVRLIWFSQTLGAGRGLEDLFDALHHVKGNWKLEIRANTSLEALDWLERQLSSELRSRVQVRPPVPPDHLAKVVASHDIGLALEVPTCRNKDLTASNKIFQYLQCGLAVIASDTAGQREVLETVPCAGQMYRSGDIPQLISILDYWLGHTSELAGMREQIYREANERLAYEKQAPRLLASVERALSIQSP